MKGLKVLLSIVLAMVFTLGGFANKAEAATTSAGDFIRPTSGTNTSGFGPRWGTNHNGVDIANSVSVPIAATAAGTVITSSWSDSYGERVYIRHYINGTYYVSVYAHMSSRSVVAGQQVKQGQIVGYMGNTGDSTGQHLHFELHVGTSVWNTAYAQNPYNYIPSTNYSSWLKTTAGDYTYYGSYQVTGWIQYGGLWYYTDPSTGLMKTNWQSIGGKWYYFQADGTMVTGWFKDTGTGKWYYLGADGAMVTGWFKDPATATWYYLGSDGAMVTGWLADGGQWYYLESNGVMVTGWKYVDANWYYFYSNGVMATNTVIEGYNIDAKGLSDKK